MPVSSGAVSGARWHPAWRGSTAASCSTVRDGPAPKAAGASRQSRKKLECPEKTHGSPGIEPTTLLLLCPRSLRKELGNARWISNNLHSPASQSAPTFPIVHFLTRLGFDLTFPPPPLQRYFPDTEENCEKVSSRSSIPRPSAPNPSARSITELVPLRSAINNAQNIFIFIVPPFFGRFRLG